MSPPPLGLYSIGIRGLDAGQFLALAAGWEVPFAHLRGEPRGYDLARTPAARLTAWARQARKAGVPVTLVTADIDLADFTAPGTARYHQAARELAALAASAKELGTRATRLLARAVPPEGVDRVTPDPGSPARERGLAHTVFDPGASGASGLLAERAGILGAVDGLVLAEHGPQGGERGHG